ncbi:MAG: GNAT family N-acetyltransferase [Marinagarivorans sp.]|nr:GNAT family N-acetyltransferase [Marinagarivorans sp.]
MTTLTCPIPPTLVPMIKVRQVRWPAQAAELEKIREQVFIREQQVPPHLEWDGLEQESQHFLAYFNDRPVGVARLVKHHKLTRMAVLKNYRQQGIGSALIKSVCRAAMHAGMTEIVADAQIAALGFYLNHEFSVTGSSFYDAGILHKPVVKKLGFAQ